MNIEEYKIEIQSNSAPKISEIKTFLNKPEELTIIKKVSSNFGRKTFTAEAVVYDNKEFMEKVEPKNKKQKEGEGQTAPKPEEKPAEPKKESKPSNQAEQVGGKVGAEDITKQPKTELNDNNNQPKDEQPVAESSK